MKNLKIKFGLFSFLAILAASVFLTSCEQDEIQMNENPILSQLNESDKLILPFGVNQDEELVIEYLNNATETQINVWKSNAEITTRLASIGKLDEINSVLTVGQNISEADISNLLSTEDLQKLNSFDTNTSLRTTLPPNCVRVYLGPPVGGNGPDWHCHWARKKCCNMWSCYYAWYKDC